MTRGASLRTAALAVIALFAGVVARAEDPSASVVPRGLEGVAFEQRLGAQVPLDLTFVDESDAPRRLAELVHDRPVILTLNYYSCPMLCSAELDGLVGSLKALAFNPGTEFEIVTVSIDPSEKPEIAAAKKARYVDSYRRVGADRAWHFLTGDDASIEALADAVGFRYRYDETSKQYAHAAGIVVLTPDGHVSRYFFGIEYPPRDVRLALVESSAGKIGNLVDKAMLFCFHYDPTTTRYGLAAMTAVRAAGVATVLVLVAFVVLGGRGRHTVRPSVPVVPREVSHGA